MFHHTDELFRLNLHLLNKKSSPNLVLTSVQNNVNKSGNFLIDSLILLSIKIIHVIFTYC